jgi:poly(A) polymerase
MQHKDVYTHSLVVMEQAIERETDGPDLVLRLAALLHDIGKPATRRKEPDGRVSFHHHEVVGAKMTRRRLRELRYPKSVIDDVAQLVFLHLRFHGYSGGEWTDSAVRRYVRDAGHLLDTLNELVRCDVTTANLRREREIQNAIDDLEERIARLSEQEELASLRAPINGNDVMAYLGLQSGPAIGEIMTILLEKRIEDGPYPASEAYEIARSWALEKGMADPGPAPDGEEE